MAVLCLSGLGTAYGDEPRYEWEGVQRIVAVGDIHGAYENFVRVLQNAKLVDEKLRWIGGETHLVQTGDIVDRGPHSRKVMDLLMKLEKKAADAGGMVHVLIGNHEAMNIVGILDLVSDEEFAAFTDRDSRRRRDHAFERYYEGLKREAKDAGEKPPKKSAVRKEFEEQFPLGYIEHRRAFSPEGRYGEWILSHNTAIKINGILFSHGDWSEKFSQIGIEEVNSRVRRELRRELPLEEGLTFDEESPLQYRGLAHTTLTRAAQGAMLPVVERIVDNLGARRMVAGHTVTAGLIESRFGGKHISIDTGMLELYHGGHRIALEIVGDSLRAIHDEGTVAVPETLDETNLNDYVRAVAEVDPTNVDVQLKLVDMLREEGRLTEAVPILERLFEHPEHIPFRYREILGTEYENRGEKDKAQGQFELYLKGLARLVEANPGNLNLANLLARFCVDKGLELELAEETIRRAVEKAPDNYSFRLTLARVQIEKKRYADALKTIDGWAPANGFGYEIHYLSGLAYLGLDDAERARQAFQEAVEAAPNREEARNALKKLGTIP